MLLSTFVHLSSGYFFLFFNPEEMFKKPLYGLWDLGVQVEHEPSNVSLIQKRLVGNMDLLQGVRWRVIKMIKVWRRGHDWSICPVRKKNNKTGTVQAGEGKAQGISSSSNTGREGGRRRESSSCQWALKGPEARGTNWNRGGGIWTSGNAATVRITKHWQRSPREAVESPSLEIIKSHLDTLLNKVLDNQLQLTLLQLGPFHPQPTCEGRMKTPK